MSAAEFARRLGVAVDKVIADCKAGRIVGAEFDRVTWRWWVFRRPGGRGCATWPLRRDLFRGAPRGAAPAGHAGAR